VGHWRVRSRSWPQLSTRSFSRENHVRDGIGHVISIFDGSVKSQKPEQRVGLEAFMPKLLTVVEAKHSFADQNFRTYRRSNLSSKKGGARNYGGIKSGMKRRLQVFALICLPWGCVLSLVEGAYVVMVVAAPHLVEE
jgi:hypothetical protein